MPLKNREKTEKAGPGKPTEHTCWPKGQSGNPKGRPPKEKTLSTYLRDAIDLPISALYHAEAKALLGYPKEAPVPEEVKSMSLGELLVRRRVHNGKTAPLDGMFEATSGRRVKRPTLHSRCRCAMRLNIKGI